MRTRVLSAGVAICVLLAAVALLLPGCGRRYPPTPEDLFAELQRLNEAGDSVAIWDSLLTPDARQRHVDAIDGYRKVIVGNPNDTTDRIFRQFKCTRSEVLTLSYVELFRRENLGNERALVGAKLVSKDADPRRPGEFMLKYETPGGPWVSMRARSVEGGYALVEFIVTPR